MRAIVWMLAVSVGVAWGQEEPTDVELARQALEEELHAFELGQTSMHWVGLWMSQCYWSEVEAEGETEGARAAGRARYFERLARAAAAAEGRDVDVVECLRLMAEDEDGAAVAPVRSLVLALKEDVLAGESTPHEFQAWSSTLAFREQDGSRVLHFDDSWENEAEEGHIDRMAWLYERVREQTSWGERRASALWEAEWAWADAQFEPPEGVHQIQSAANAYGAALERFRAGECGVLEVRTWSRRWLSSEEDWSHDVLEACQAHVARMEALVEVAVERGEGEAGARFFVRRAQERLAQLEETLSDPNGPRPLR